MTAIWAIAGGVGGAVRIALAVFLMALVSYVYASLVAIPNAVDAAKAAYAVELRAETSKQLADEIKRQTGAYQTVIDAYQAQYRNVLAKEDIRNVQVEKDIAENEQTRSAEGRACPLSQSDLEFLRK